MIILFICSFFVPSQPTFVQDWEMESPHVRQFNHILCFDAEA